jgi:hypothetical protein
MMALQNHVPEWNYVDWLCLAHAKYTPLAVVSRARNTLRVSTTATIAQIPAASSKEGAVIGAIRENSIGVITDIRHI